MLAALVDVATAIRQYISSQPVIVAQGVIHYTISGYGSLTKTGPPASVQLFLNALDYEIIGWSVSYLGSFPTFGTNPNDDDLQISLWNYTTNSQVGNTLNLNVNQTNDSHTNEGNAIGPNIAKGNIAGVKIAFDDTEGQTFTGKAFDFFLYVKPTQLQSPS